ncbi:MAG: permease [Ilumatobacter sp.]|uniref:permease n=1 Tax=Ilumatobacter sp. TaxID=1967498 RepID=UPI0026353ECF|nr:permease [Ilumatobacter sp.]MDJ0768579.1 permease [Ilumatobacter sp.]
MDTSTVDHPAPAPEHVHRGASVGAWLVLAVLLVAALARNRVAALGGDDVRLWGTLFVSISVQALPFLVLGVVISGLVAAFVSPEFVERIVPRRPVVAVPAAGVAGFALPGCEGGSVPIAGRLISTGTPPAAALTFLLAAPAINPVVMIATAVAFPADHRVVVARFVASFAAAVAVGAWWANRTGSSLISQGHGHETPTGGRWARFSSSAAHDLVHAGGYLVVGAMAAATLQLVVPSSIVRSAAGDEVVAIATMALLAVVLSICSEADAFVAAGMPQFSLSSRLVFMVVGPVVDLKLIAMHAGVFGRRFAMVFAPVALGVAVLCAVVVGQVLL